MGAIVHQNAIGGERKMHKRETAAESAKVGDSCLAARSAGSPRPPAAGWARPECAIEDSRGEVENSR